MGDTAAARRTVDRLTRISPSEPEPWFLAGRAALEDGNEPEAIRDWRNCLLSSSRFLPKILAALNKQLIDSPKDRNDLFGQDPVLLKKAAEVAFETKLFELEKPLLEDAATILARGDRTPEQDWMLGKIYAKLDDDNKALDAMRRAWQAKPRQFDWGIELAERLEDAGQLKEAREVIIAVQSLMPNPASRFRSGSC